MKSYFIGFARRRFEYKFKHPQEDIVYITKPEQLDGIVFGSDDKIIWSWEHQRGISYQLFEQFRDAIQSAPGFDVLYSFR